MRSHVLTELERKQARAYIRQNGERTLNVQVLVSRVRSYLPQIRADVALSEKLLEAYERNTGERQ